MHYLFISTDYIYTFNLIPTSKYKKCENHNFSVLYNF